MKTTASRTFPFRRLICFLGMMLVAFRLSAQPAVEGDDLFGQMDSLQEQMHIKITGLERIDNAAKVATHGSLEQQFEQLFAPYNHIISRNRKGQLEQVSIIGKKEPKETNRIVLPARLEGKHFIVSVSLSGDGRLWQNLDMMIDTGADLVVLPDSMIAQLGLADSPFRQQQMQTANGTTTARIGELQELKLAGETITHVAVAFVPDRLLGDTRLLGMSVLGRYQINIDDRLQLITLFKK